MKIIFLILSLFCLNLQAQPACYDSLWQYVYHPNRLEIQDIPCITVTGKVQQIKKEPDGDLHIQLDLDTTYLSYLDDGNYNRQNGLLVLEVICACNIKHNSAAVYACKDYINNITIPKVGEYIKVSGTFVHDNSSGHGWNEIHPVNELIILR